MDRCFQTIACLVTPVCVLVAAACGKSGVSATRAAPSSPRLTVLVADGGHLDWLLAPGGRVVFDRAGADGYFDIWVMNPDGTSQRNLTEGKRELPGRHIGQPAWHPSGRFIAFQAEKAGLPSWIKGKTEPGAGVLNDLWLMDAEGQRFWKLIDLRLDTSADAPAILHPHFSPDGSRLTWAERVGRGPKAFGSWVIRLAEFAFQDGQPILLNLRTLTPGQPSPRPGQGAFYETHGFYPDGSRLLFSSDVDQGLKLYELELATGRLRRLTHDPRVWDEHAHYSPDGSRILYMSSEGLVFRVRPFDLQTEFWLMKPDGTERRRLTGFHEPGHPHYRGGGFAVAADSAWRADGKAFAGLVIRYRPETERRGEGEIVLVELE
jgi:Tol biopolymer transport system component